MTIHPTDDRITSDVTPHVAYRHPSPVPGEHGWVVSWLPNRVVGYSLAISAMMIADLAVSIEGDEERRLRINPLAHELGMSGAMAIRLVLAPVVHDTHAIPADDEPKPARPCPSCSQCGKTFHVSDEEIAAAEAIGDHYPVAEPAKTHDLSIRREFGNVVVRADGEAGNRVVYLQEGVARDLGRVLEALTPAQRQVLVDDLTGGEK